MIYGREGDNKRGCLIWAYPSRRVSEYKRGSDITGVDITEVRL